MAGERNGSQVRQPDNARELADALADLDAFTQRGREAARQAVDTLERSIADASREMGTIVDHMKDSDVLNEDIGHSLVNQLSVLHNEYAAMPDGLREDIESLPDGPLSIAVFGRQGSGKATLMATLTRGNGDPVGAGRLDSDIRSYGYRDLSFTDIPGSSMNGHPQVFAGQALSEPRGGVPMPSIEAFDEADIAENELAIEFAREADMIILLLASDGIEDSELGLLAQLKQLGKPVICLVNVMMDVPDDGGFEAFATRLDGWFADGRNAQSIRHDVVSRGEALGQDWSRLPFAFAHLKAAYLAGRPQSAGRGDRLLAISHFAEAEHIIGEEVRRNGRLDRMRSYVDTVSVPMLRFFEDLFAQSMRNSQDGKLLIHKRCEQEAWTREFVRQSRIDANAFVDDAMGRLRSKVPDFAGKHARDDDPSGSWEAVVASEGLREGSERLVRSLLGTCAERLNRLGREVELDFKSTQRQTERWKLSNEQPFNPQPIFDAAETAIGIAARIIPVFDEKARAPQVLGAIAPALPDIAQYFTPAKPDSKAAREQLESRIYKSIESHDRAIRSQLMHQVDAMEKDFLRAAASDLRDIARVLFHLSRTQHDLGMAVNRRLSELNTMLVREAIACGDRDPQRVGLVRAARIPGDTTLLVLKRGRELSRSLERDLEELLGENVAAVHENWNRAELISETLGPERNVEDIRIEEVLGRALIAHVDAIDELDPATSTRLRLAEQLSELLFMR